MGMFFGFDFFNIVFIVMFTLIVGMFILSAVNGIRQWNKNNNSPRLTVPVTVVSKRADVSRHRHGTVTENSHYNTFTTYYVTFQVESGDRIELSMSGNEYGMLVEGDTGMLNFQGTRYLGFERRC